MAAAAQIPLPAPLKTSSTSNLACEWKTFKGKSLNYVKTAKVIREEKDFQAAFFLACIGSDAYEIFSRMEFDDEADKVDPDKLMYAFEKHCVREMGCRLA